MANVASFMQVLNDWAPFDTQMDYDNAGLLVGNPHQAVSKVLFALDLTEEVAEEAAAIQADLIITHHPLIFPKIKAIRTDGYQGRILQCLLKNDISYIAAHTNLDAAIGGVSYFSAELLGLQELQILQIDTKSTQKYNRDIGFGVMGTYKNPMPVDAFFSQLEQAFGSAAIRYAGNRTKAIKKVALCGGTAVSLLPAAIANDADVFVTADIKYHEYFHEQENFFLIDVGHYESEMAVIEGMKTYLAPQFKDILFIATKHNTNPMKVYSSTASQNLT